MIKSIKHRGLKRFAAKGDASKLPVKEAAKVARILAALEAATTPRDMDLPGLMFHSLKMKPVRYSVRVTGNWRLTWAWEDGHAVAVDIEDYH